MTIVDWKLFSLDDWLCGVEASVEYWLLISLLISDKPSRSRGTRSAASFEHGLSGAIVVSLVRSTVTGDWKLVWLETRLG